MHCPSHTDWHLLQLSPRAARADIAFAARTIADQLQTSYAYIILAADERKHIPINNRAISTHLEVLITALARSRPVDIADTIELVPSHGSVFLLFLHAQSPESITQLLTAKLQSLRLAFHPSAQHGTSNDGSGNDHAPIFDRLLSAIRSSNTDAFCEELTAELPRMLNELAAQPKKQRKTIGPLAAALSYSQYPDDFLATIKKIVHGSQAQSHSPPQEQAHLLRLMDSCAYLLFDLIPNSDCEAMESLRFVVKYFTMQRSAAPLFVRVMRDNYLKALSFAPAFDHITKLLSITNTEDAHATMVIFLAQGGIKQADNHSLRKLLASLSQLSDEGLARLARDIRRMRVSKRVLTTSQLTALHNAVITARRSRSRTYLFNLLLVLRFTGLLSYSVLSREIYHSRQKNLLKPPQLTTLLAIAGLDTPFIIDVNKRLMEHSYSFFIPTPSRFNNLTQYLEATTDMWSHEQSIARSDNASSVAQPLVTVIMATRNPNLSLLAFAFRSLDMQTHANFELILIDDASNQVEGSEIHNVLEKFPTLAARSRCVRMREPVGQYECRNQALRMAAGSFITVHDDDDVSHPERLARQLQPLLRHSEIVACHTLHIRIADDAHILLDGDYNEAILGDCPVSFLWRKKVFSDVGHFLPSRSRADVEFRGRLTRYYGPSALHTIPHPLLLVRGSLATISSGVEYSSRTALQAFRQVMPHIPLHVSSEESELRWLPRNLQPSSKR